VAGTPAGRITSANPARTSEVVADVSPGDASVLVAAAQAAREARPTRADVPAPVRGRVIEANAQRLTRM